MSFDTSTNEWQKLLPGLMDARRDALCDPDTGIVIPASGYPSYRPFDDADYSYGADLGSLSQKPWSVIRALPAASLIPGNPLAQSRHRPQGLAVWDAAVGIPGCRYRTPEPLAVADIKATRNINTHWTQWLAAMGRMGPLGVYGSVIRPKFPYLLDFTAIDDGWMLLHAAHVLAHRRADLKASATITRKVAYSRTAKAFAQAAAEVAVAWLYDLPLNLDTEAETPGSGMAMPQYGIEVAVSTDFTSPRLMVPWSGPQAPVFDKSIAYVATSVYIQPPPYSFTEDIAVAGNYDRWACMPTMVAILGWECVDYICHQPIAAWRPEDRQSMPMYVVYPESLLPPPTFWAYLAMARTSRGDPVYGSRSASIRDWIANKVFDGDGARFMDHLERTMALPCPLCKSLRRDDDHFSARPRRKIPSTLKKDRDADIIAWLADDKKLERMLTDAGIAYAAVELKSVKAAKRRYRLRRQRHMERLRALRADAIYLRIAEKYARYGDLTDSEMEILRSRRHDNENPGY